MNIDPKSLRQLRLAYSESKQDHGKTCREIIDTAKFLGCEQGAGKEDVRVSLAYIEGLLAGIAHCRSAK